ncbi:MAG: spore protease YyaC [Clostridiales bacterium]|nr:spore protease YyaC [Clostridiales bacterium]
MKNIYIDSILPNSFFEIRDYLYKELMPLIKSNRHIIFLCIGTDRATGDSLGPIIGYKLKNLKRNNIHIYGSLESPIHSKNIVKIIENINLNYKDPYVIAIDACLGHFHDVGKVIISKSPLTPGAAVNHSLPSVGNMSITGVVNISGNYEFMILQNTRLYTVMALADCISNGINHFILRCFGGKSYSSDTSIFIE